ncbi:hypothetical protein MHBO_000040 [Bonamia ostreae]|uniref:Uncharacterized protein n=1 Tax=Bonamia ostreae TaxID=126728 RepID=A0ABV2AE40_9EUKA
MAALGIEPRTPQFIFDVQLYHCPATSAMIFKILCSKPLIVLGFNLLNSPEAKELRARVFISSFATSGRETFLRSYRPSFAAFRISLTSSLSMGLKLAKSTCLSHRRCSGPDSLC